MRKSKSKQDQETRDSLEGDSYDETAMSLRDYRRRAESIAESNHDSIDDTMQFSIAFDWNRI